MHWQNTKKRRYFFALFYIIVVASIINIVGVGVSQASAQTPLSDTQKQTCFNTFNGYVIDGSGYINLNILVKTQLDPCNVPGVCIVPAFGGKVTCTDPVVAKAAAEAKEAAVIPLVTALCGSGGGGDASISNYQACSSKVRTDFQSCVSVFSSPTVVAQCFVKTPSGAHMSIPTARTLIQQGVDNAKAVTAKGVQDAAAAKCAAPPTNGIIEGGKCVPKPPDAPKTSCTIDGIGWIVCPTVNFLAKVTDGAFGFLSESFLRTDPSLFSTSSKTYTAWAMMRSIANVAFVIAFLLIIFSQMTSYGITNYGVKKLLPRLVIAAILVNLSYFVCQIAIDLSNILGFSIKEMFDALSGKIMIGAKMGTVSAGASGVGFAGLAGSILALAGAVALVYALLATLIPVLLAALVALIMILFILVARQVLIILLVVISPLAFVAFLLPNTQPLFKKWQKAFTAMLMLFPIIALVFGVSTLASTILNTSLTNNLTGDTGHWMSQIIAAAVMILPLFIIPGLLKKSLDGVGGIGAKMNGIGNKLGGALGKKGAQGFENSRVGQFKKYRQGENTRKRALVQSGAYKGRGLAGAKSKLYGAFNDSKYSGKFGDRSAASGIGVAEEIEEKEVNEAVKLQNSGVDPRDRIQTAAKNLADATEAGDVVKARAATRILLGSGTKGLDTLHDTLKTQEASGKLNADVARNLRVDLNGAGLKGKDNALATWAYTDKSTIAGQAGKASTFSDLSAGELAGQSEARLEQAAQAGGISAQQATEILGNQNTAQGLSPAKRALLEGLSGLATPPQDTPQQQQASPAGGSSSGLYRVNAAGNAIRPSGSSGNSGVPLGANQQSTIDAHEGSLTIAHDTEQAALAQGYSPEDAQKFGDAAYKNHPDNK